MAKTGWSSLLSTKERKRLVMVNTEKQRIEFTMKALKASGFEFVSDGGEDLIMADIISIGTDVICFDCRFLGEEHIQTIVFANWNEEKEIWTGDI